MGTLKRKIRNLMLKNAGRLSGLSFPSCNFSILIYLFFLFLNWLRAIFLNEN